MFSTYSLPQQKFAAYARVETAKASRYLKALSNHFQRKVTASYDEAHGRVHFPFGDCKFQAEADALQIIVTADSEDLLMRVKYVVADHLRQNQATDQLRVWRVSHFGGHVFAPTMVEDLYPYPQYHVSRLERLD